MAVAQGAIGKGIKIKGEVKSSGDLIIEGYVEGKVQLDNHLVIGPTGEVKASLEVERLTVEGKATGDIAALGRVEIKSSGHVEGDIRAPSVVIEEGAHFRGAVHMDLDLGDDP